jgi:hypothetical protein
MKEIRILLNESTFTQLCKMGYLQYNTSMFSRTDVYVTKNDIVELSTGKIVEKEVDGSLFKIALQDIGIELVREIVRRSPVYSDIVERIILSR